MSRALARAGGLIPAMCADQSHTVRVGGRNLPRARGPSPIHADEKRGPSPIHKKGRTWRSAPQCRIYYDYRSSNQRVISSWSSASVRTWGSSPVVTPRASRRSSRSWRWLTTYSAHLCANPWGSAGDLRPLRMRERYDGSTATCRAISTLEICKVRMSASSLRENTVELWLRPASRYDVTRCSSRPSIRSSWAIATMPAASLRTLSPS